MFYINRKKKTKLLIVVSIETTYTDCIQYATEQRRNKPLDVSLRYQHFLTLEYLLFHYAKRKEKKKRHFHSNSRFSKPVILTLKWHHELRLFIIISFFVIIFLYRHQWNTNLSFSTSFNRFVKRNSIFTQ